MRIPTRHTASLIAGALLTVGVGVAATAPAHATSTSPSAASAYPKGLGPEVKLTGKAPTGYTVTFRYYDPSAKNVWISGQWYFQHPGGKPGDQVLPAQWKPGDFPLGYPDGGPDVSWPNQEMTEIGTTGVWTFTTPLPSGFFGYGFGIDCDSTGNNCASSSDDPDNPPWMLPTSIANGAGTAAAAPINSSGVYVPGDDAFGNPSEAVYGPAAGAKGKLEAVGYRTSASLVSAGATTRRALAVYLPPGYNPHRTTPYPTLYLVHGWQLNDGDWTSGGDLKNMMDNLIDDGLIEPMVVVITDYDGFKVPSIHPPDVCTTSDESVWLREYNADLDDIVVPLVQSRFDVSDSASMRAYAGFSQGGCVVNSALMNTTSEFGYYAPMSPAPAVPTVPEIEADKAALGKVGIMIGGGWNEPLPTTANPSFPAPRTEIANLEAAGVGVTPGLVNGGHDWATWDSGLIDFLENVAFRPVVESDMASTQASQQAAMAMAVGQANTEAYVGQPSDFPVSTVLKTVPKGARITFVQCGTPFCAQIYPNLKAAAKAMGVTLTQVVVPANATASAVAAVFNSVVASKPAAVIVAGVDASLWKSQAGELRAAKTPVVTTAVNDAAVAGITAPQEAEGWAELTGSLLADYIGSEIACVPGETAVCSPAHAVVYDMPSLGFTGPIVSTFDSELAKACYDCTTRTVDLPASDIGPNASTSDIIADLKAHPDTTVAVFPANEVAGTDLPAAIKAAGLNVAILGLNPGTDNLEMIKNDGETAGLAIDSPVASWTLLDMAAREITGQALTPAEQSGNPVMEFLTSSEVTSSDITNGWTGYPGYAQTFEKLWGVSG